MEINIYMNKYRNLRYEFFKWRYELNLIYQISLALSFACITGLMAQVKFFMPGSPVPITGQTFAILLAGILLGKWGGISQIMYVGIGVAGVPWFADMQSGIGALTGATGGYLIGFILAAFFLGYLTDKYIRSRRLLSMLPLMLFANFTLIYIPGLIVLYLWWTTAIGSIGIIELLAVGMIPFIIGDVIKVVAAAGIAKGILPKISYGQEVDIEKAKNWYIP